MGERLEGDFGREGCRRPEQRQVKYKRWILKYTMLKLVINVVG